MMQAFQEASTPGEPTVSQATSTAKMVLGGRYLHDVVRGEIAGMGSFEGMDYTAYDNVAGVYRTAAMNLEGMTRELSLARPEGGGNCANWILGHLISVQNGMLKAAGVEPVWDSEALSRAGSEPITGPEGGHRPGHDGGSLLRLAGPVPVGPRGAERRDAGRAGSRPLRRGVQPRRAPEHPGLPPGLPTWVSWASPAVPPASRGPSTCRRGEAGRRGRRPDGVT